MDKTKTVKTRKTPTPAFAVISFLVIVAVLVALINLGVDTTMSVFIAALIAVVIALLLDIPWADVERTLLRVVSDCIPTFLIVIMVGMLVGIWMAGGTVPALMYYGMKLISPKILVPLAFVLSGLTAEFTGTSFGSVATMGIALVGVASTTSIPVPLVIAAVVCGAWFGDKMSPLSDTTNLASGVSRVPLYDHIGSMMYTTIPAALVALVLFTAAGLMHSGGEMDTTRANLICDTLAEHFNLNPILILPAILVLLVSVFKLPALLGMGLTVVVSIVFAMVFQGVNFVELMNYAANGFTLSTGVDIVDPMLNRGGITSMTGLLITFMVASVMGGIITATGILDVLAQGRAAEVHQEPRRPGDRHSDLLLHRQLPHGRRPDRGHHRHRADLRGRLRPHGHPPQGPLPDAGGCGDPECTHRPLGRCHAVCDGGTGLRHGVYPVLLVHLHCTHLLHPLCLLRLWYMGQGRQQDVGQEKGCCKVIESA